MQGPRVTRAATRWFARRLQRATMVRFGIVASTVTLAVVLPIWLASTPPRAPSPADGAAIVTPSSAAASQPAAPMTDGPSPSMTSPSASPSPVGTPASSHPATSTAATASPRPKATPAPLVVPGTLYVATTGSDANPGTIGAPLRTVGRAAAIARPGSTVWIRGGTYRGFDVTRSGITFASYTGETAVISDSSREDVIEFNGVTSGALQRLVVQGSTAQYGSGVTIKDSSGVTITASTIRNNRTFGIVVVSSSKVRIDGNKITGNADGIEERYTGNGLAITNNQIYGNTKMVDSGRGMEGINFYKSTGSVTVSGNRLWDNGTHFEVYGASNLVLSGNVSWNGQIMETGTDGPACDHNTFVRNIGYKGSGYKGGSTSGMILRCASHNLIAQNTLDGFDLFAFDIVDGTKGVSYGGSIAGLQILNNIVVGGRAFSIDSALPTSVRIDYTLVYNVGSTATYGNHIAYVKGVGQFDTLEAFASATGYETHGVFGDPRFVNRAGRDYHLQAGSPAIDRGLVVLSDGYAGNKPDMGRYEFH